MKEEKQFDCTLCYIERMLWGDAPEDKRSKEIPPMHKARFIYQGMGVCGPHITAGFENAKKMRENKIQVPGMDKSVLEKAGIQLK